MLLAVLAIELARLPAIGHLGALSIALLLGLGWRVVNQVPPEQHGGIGFSARNLLRLGIILLGVRLNLGLVMQAGLKILLLDATVITAGLLGISWLGRRFGLEPGLACLIAVDSSICGASAVAAAAPALRAQDADITLVIPLGSLIGTAAMLGLTLAQHHWAFTPARYGMMAGGTLHEVAQVMAAVAPFPATAAVGTVTKLTRVVLLVPAVLVLGWVYGRDRLRPTGMAGQAAPRAAPRPWFVVGFLLTGLGHTLALHFLPAWHVQIGSVNRAMLTAANFLLTMAMAGMGLQVDIVRFRANGLRVLGTALLGWTVLAVLAASEIWILTD